MNAVEVKKGVYWVGAIDWEIRNFHGYTTNRGATYNAFLIIDEKITLIDAVKNTFADELIARISSIIDPAKIDYIVSPEARGFLFGTAVANRLEVGFIPVRKKGKLPPTTVETEIDYQKEYGKDILELPKLVEESYQNKNFYIIDDIYATGNTVKAIRKGIEDLGGNIVGTGVIINIVDLNQEKNIFSLLEVQEET